ncbi:MAG: 50S ribosomal protein L2 [Candidatus Pacearchaeota archaeon]|jgi:large subunit ribosomal protein L2|nr:50S ribosomal protein L2 [Candidatus Pacearchaeota archaeon]MDP7520741.1 50S ribosomal protein L2 [Candidatus Pacearchaeota archaeon]|tara:strand:+ start:25113 stop:25811 length:699 start_codon:yes stop_codon:yes gene_type:complete
MGKRIITQARGKGSHTYRVRKKAFRYKLQYPSKLDGKGTVIRLFDSAAHSSPLAKIKYEKGIFYIPAFKEMIEGQEINFGGKKIKQGNIIELKNIPVKTKIYNIESRPRDGGIFIKSAGNSAVISRIIEKDIFILMPSKKERKFNSNCRAIIGVIAGTGRLDKPIVKAGKKYHIKKSKSKLWPRTSAVKMNAIDHPFGSGRAKNPKSKIAKRNAPPGRKVGLLRPKRTGKRK